MNLERRNFEVGDKAKPSKKWLPDLLKSYKLDKEKVYTVCYSFTASDVRVNSIKLEGINTTFDASYFDLIEVEKCDGIGIVVKNEEVSKPDAAVSALDKQVSGDHYKDCGIQPIEYIHANALNYFEGNAVKYITRHRKKNGKADIEKAIHYLELLLELEYKDK